MSGVYEDPLRHARYNYEGSSGGSVGMECGICYTDIDLDEVVQIQQCCHTFCRECLRHYLEVEVRDSKVAITCPTCRAEASTVGLGDAPLAARVSDSLIRHLLPQQQLRKYERLCLALAASTQGSTLFLCRQDGCDFAGVLEHADWPLFTCLRCADSYCVRCHCDWHVDMTCEEYQARQKATQEADESFQEWFRENSRPCPKCGHAVQKLSPDECNKLTCANRQCRALICALCGVLINGYDHFNNRDSPCYGKLWEGTTNERRRRRELRAAQAQAHPDGRPQQQPNAPGAGDARGPNQAAGAGVAQNQNEHNQQMQQQQQERQQGGAGIGRYQNPQLAQQQQEGQQGGAGIGRYQNPQLAQQRQDGENQARAGLWRLFFGGRP